MKTMKKHQFEAVSLLTSQGGLLDVTIVPVLGQPSWLIPTSLILEINDFDEFIWNYIWRGQDVAVYHLLPRDVPPEKIIVLEGNTPVHRVALQTSANLTTKQWKISDVKDAELPEEFFDVGAESVVYERKTDIGDDVIPIPFIYQTVQAEGEIYIIPDLDMIAYQLVELDS